MTRAPLNPSVVVGGWLDETVFRRLAWPAGECRLRERTEVSHLPMVASRGEGSPVGAAPRDDRRVFASVDASVHDASGAGYVFLADEVITLDPANPTLAARLVQPLGTWRRHDPARQALMQHQLERILGIPDLSKNTYEMVAKSLA